MGLSVFSQSRKFEDWINCHLVRGIEGGDTINKKLPLCGDNYYSFVGVSCIIIKEQFFLVDLQGKLEHFQ